MLKKQSIQFIVSLFFFIPLSACVTTSETQRTIEPQKTVAAATPYYGPKTKVAVAGFENRSTYMNGVFSGKVDRIGNQARTILKTHLQQSQRFQVLDRENLTAAAAESAYLGQEQEIKGARYAITGDVSEFGRKAVGDRQLFGILGRGKQQIAYAKVSLNVVDVLTSEIVYSTQGAGEYALKNREVVGFGATAGYDQTLNGKVLDLAIREAVTNMANEFPTVVE